MAHSLKLEIVTPEKQAYSEEVSSVLLPGVEGELGILPNHIPLLTMIKPGHLLVHQDGKDHDLAVGEGFVEVTGKKVIVLTDMALEASEIDEGAVEEAMKRAEQKLAEVKHENPDEAAILMATIQKSMAQLKVKRRRR